MNNEWEFLSEYKAVEKICKEMGYENGVTSYIEEMEQTVSEGERFVSDWNDCYYTLKHLRYIRNQIAHDNDADYEITPQDFKNLKIIHGNLISQKDPLTLLRINMQRVNKTQITRPQVSVTEVQSKGNNSDVTDKVFFAMAICAIVALGVFIIYSLLH